MSFFCSLEVLLLGAEQSGFVHTVALSQSERSEHRKWAKRRRALLLPSQNWTRPRAGSQNVFQIMNPLEIINKGGPNWTREPSELWCVSSFVFLWKSSKHMYCSHMTTQSYDRVVTWSGGHMIEWWKKAQEKSERNRDRGQMFLIEAVLISFILNTFPLNQQLQRGRNFSPFNQGF